MTITTWPLNAVNGSPAYAGRALRQTTNAPFLAGATAARPLGAFSGVRPGTSPTTVTATSTTVTVAPVAGVIDGQIAAEAGPYTFSSDAAVSFTSQTSDVFPAADQSNPRVDIVYVQVNDPSESDGSATPGLSIRYLAGSPAATPATPSTPARSFVLAQVNVPKAGGGSPTVTWVAPITASAGGEIGVQKIAQLPAATPGLRARVMSTEASYFVRSNGDGTYRWVRAAGGHWHGRRSSPQALSSGGTPTTLNAFATQSDSDRIDGWVTAATDSGIVTLTEGDYVIDITAVLNSRPQSTRAFVSILVGGVEVARANSWTEELISASTNVHAGPSGLQVTAQVYQTQTPSNPVIGDLRITKVS